MSVVRALIVLWVIGFGLQWGAGTAAAHGEGGLGPEAHLPRIVALDPAVPGLDVVVIEAGARLRIDNHTGRTVTVAPAAGPGRDQPPIAAGQTARWRDARVVAAAADPPPAQGRRAWEIPLRVGDQQVLLRGEQVWPAAPSSGPWWLATLLAAAATAMIGCRAVRRRWWAPALAGVTLLVAAAQLVHVLGSALIVEDRPLLATALGAAGPALLAWVAAATGAALVLGGHGFGPLLCSLSGAVFALVTAFNANNFSSAVLPFAGDPALDRAAVVLTLGGGLGLFLSGFAALRELSPSTPDGSAAASA